MLIGLCGDEDAAAPREVRQACAPVWCEECPGAHTYGETKTYKETNGGRRPRETRGTRYLLAMISDDFRNRWVVGASMAYCESVEQLLAEYRQHYRASPPRGPAGARNCTWLCGHLFGDDWRGWASK